MICPLCQAESPAAMRFARSIMSSSKSLDVGSSLFLCARCGHCYTAVELDLASYYATEYDSTLTDGGPDEIVSTKDGQIVFRTDLDYSLLRRKLGDDLAGDPLIFEYGCGRGRILSRLFKDGHRNLAAFDLSELYRPAIAPFVAPERIFIGKRPADVAADVVISLFVLEHDDDPLGSLLYLRQVLRPGGRLYVMLPNYETNRVDLGCADHVNHFSPAVFRALLEGCGYEQVEMDADANIGAFLATAQRGAGGERARADVPPAAQRAQAEAAVEPFVRFVGWVEGLAAQLPAGGRVLYYGAGLYASLIDSILTPKGIRCAGVVDANPRKQGGVKLGCTVMSPEELSQGAYRDADLVMCINPVISADVGAKFQGVVRAVHVP